jgi:biotin operon repressor
MAQPLGGYRTLTDLAARLGYSRTYVRRKCREQGIPILEHARRSWVSPADQRKLRKILPPREEDRVTGLACKAG